MKEAEIVAVLRVQNEEYKSIEEEHRKLDITLDEINKKRYLTPEEEVEKKKLQKHKLHLKDRMAQIIREYHHHNN